MSKRIDETIPRRCKECNEVKPASEFYRCNKRKDGTYGLQGDCKKCRRISIELYHKAYPERRAVIRKKMHAKRYARLRNDPVTLMKLRIRGARRKAELGGWKPCDISVEELLESFTGFCQNSSCGVPESECIQRLNMDHNHETGEFRGWLCSNCNRAAGLLGDSHERILGLACFIEQGSVLYHG